MSIDIRAYRSSDIDDVIELMTRPRVVHHTLQMPYRSADEIREMFQKPSDNLHRLVATVQDQGRERVVGVLGLHNHKGRRRHVGDIGMCVHDDYQGRGVGTRLMEGAIDLAEKWLGLTRLELTVYVDNEPARRLYQKFGFVIEGEMQRYALRDGEFVSAYTMARLAQKVG